MVKTLQLEEQHRNDSAVELFAVDEMADEREFLGIGLALQAFSVGDGQKSLAHETQGQTAQVAHWGGNCHIFWIKKRKMLSLIRPFGSRINSR